MAQFLSKPFGMTPNGEKINEYIISNPGGLAVSVLNYGCIIKNIWVPTKRGPVDVVLGHDTYADYVKDFESSGSTCCGAFVGRYANRIENAVFNVGGKTYQLEANNGKNHLHGTFPRKLYEVKTFGDTLLLEAESPDGEDGFPGNLKISVRYILTEDNALRMDYRVSSDADTIINLTNHTYFNLDGGGDVLGQKLRIYASRYLEGNNETCPTGNILPVAGTPMDFRAGKPIGRDIDTGFSQTTMVGGGYAFFSCAIAPLLIQGSGIVIITASGSGMPFITKNSSVLSNIAESEPLVLTTGVIFDISSSRYGDVIVSSLANILSALPLIVLISDRKSVV